MSIDVRQMAKELGDKLVERAKKYLEDEVDPEFLREIATDMAAVQAQAIVASTEAERAAARKDLDFLDATIASFLVRNKIKVRREAWEAFEDILRTVGAVIEVVGRAALKAALGGLGDAVSS